MPVRALKKVLKRHDSSTNFPPIAIELPDTILDGFKIENYDVLVCQFKKHFDKDKKLIREINETMKGQPFVDIYRDLLLGGEPITKKYGFAFGDYIEIIFQAIERTKESKEGRIFKRQKQEIETIPIFPERMVEDLDFILEEGGSL